MGWYPDTSLAIRDLLSSLPRSGSIDADHASACVAPHAGWAYSLRIAYPALAALDSSAETVIVLGGHLGPSHRPLIAREDGAETPLGDIYFDGELRAALERRIRFDDDRFADNTVEIQLPIVKYLFPDARLLWVRLPANASSLEFGRILAETAAALGRRTVAVGSTDLTHYGANYGFAPMGSGPAALAWVREVNDRSFLDAVMAFDAEEVLVRGEGNRAACSTGAVLGAMGYAVARGARVSNLMAYGTSADSFPGPSFVGYGSVVFTDA